MSNLGNAAVSRISQAVFSMIRAIPCPPPMQADPTAYFPPRRLFRKITVKIIYTYETIVAVVLIL